MHASSTASSPSRRPTGGTPTQRPAATQRHDEVHITDLAALAQRVHVGGARCPVRLQLTEPIGPDNIGLLIDFLRDSQDPLVELWLPLSSHLEHGSLQRLQALLDQIDGQPALTALHVSVVGDDAPPEGMRLALAGSPACLKLAGLQVRPMIVGDLVPNDPHQHALLTDFLEAARAGDLGVPMVHTVAAQTARLALSVGNDPLLRAVVVLNPHFVLSLREAPTPEELQSLERCECPIGAARAITSASLPLTLHLLGSLPQAWAELDLAITETLSDDQVLQLGEAVLACEALRAVKLSVSHGVALNAAAIGAPRHGHQAQPEVLQLRLGTCPDAESAVMTLVAALRPQRLLLQCAQPSSGIAMLARLAISPAASELDSVQLSCGERDETIDLPADLSVLLPAFRRLRSLTITASVPLKSDSADRLLHAGLELLPLELIRLMPRDRHRGPGLNVPLTPATHILKGRFERQHARGALIELFGAMGLPEELGGDPVTVAALDTRSIKAIVCVSTATSASAIAHRRIAQARAIAAALVDDALTKSTLRRMLRAGRDTLDTELVAAVAEELVRLHQFDALSYLEETLGTVLHG